MGSLLTSTSMSPHKCTRDIPCCRPGCNPGSRPCSLGTAAPDNLSLCPLCASLCPKYPPPARLPRLAPASRFVPASGLVMSGAVFQCPFVPLPGSFFSRPVRHTPTMPCRAHANIPHRLFSMVVFTGLFFLSLQMAALEIRCRVTSVYVISSDCFSSSQNGL